MNTRVMFSSNKDDWETPQWLFDKYDEIYNFTLDVCANNVNHKCSKYFTLKDNGLTKVWDGRCWMNPPYGRNIKDWVEKAWNAVHIDKTAEIVVALLPARTDTFWFHEYIYNKYNTTIDFLKGRIKFVGAKNSAPFPSMIVVWR